MQYNGLHYILDAIGSPELLNDTNVTLAFINKAVELLDMTLIVAPYCVAFPMATSEMHRSLQSLEEEGLGNSKTADLLRKSLSYRSEGVYGHTAIAVIAESHIAIHTFPESGLIQVDISSCKSFPWNFVSDLLVETYSLTTRREYVINRDLYELENMKNTSSLTVL
jgi:S-adenosylmethionine/arginine decarboxylase-like enzyme